jgi:hypothetical protein|tara:strand:- start:2176 stop:2472 length:297 start_codon:yes stop_codon:yes gene_type:complete
MKLKDLATKPQLIEVEITNEKIVEKYGDSVSFFIQDKIPLEQYTKMAALDHSDVGQLIDMMKDLILDENGLPVMVDGNILPMDVLNAAVEKVTESLGK